MSFLKVGVIGLGHAGQVYHMPGLSTFDDVELAVCDIYPDVVAECAAKFNVPTSHCYTDYRKLLDDFQPDAVEVLVPQYFLNCKQNPENMRQIHLQMVQDVLACGCAVLVEKPLAMTLEDARLLTNAAEKAGVVMTFHGVRFQTTILT